MCRQQAAHAWCAHLKVTEVHSQLLSVDELGEAPCSPHVEQRKVAWEPLTL